MGEVRSTYRHLVGTRYSSATVVPDLVCLRMDRRIGISSTRYPQVLVISITLIYYDMFMPKPVRFSTHMRHFARAVCAKRTVNNMIVV